MLKCIDLKSGIAVRKRVVFPFSYRAYCCLNLRVKVIGFDIVEDLGRQVVKINKNSSTSIFTEFRRKKMRRAESLEKFRSGKPCALVFQPWNYKACNGWRDKVQMEVNSVWDLQSQTFGLQRENSCIKCALTNVRHFHSWGVEHYFQAKRRSSLYFQMLVSLTHRQPEGNVLEGKAVS